jgi:hypothetical protein
MVEQAVDMANILTDLRNRGSLHHSVRKLSHCACPLLIKLPSILQRLSIPRLIPCSKPLPLEPI